MPWFKVDDALAFHSKTVAAGVAAMGLWLRAGSWSSQQLTDGFIPEHMVPPLSDGTPELATRLVDVGYWDTVPGGYCFHEWDERNPTRAEVEQKRKDEAARKAKWRESKAIKAATSGNVENGPAGVSPDVPQVSQECPAGTTASVTELSALTRPDPTRPDPTTKEDPPCSPSLPDQDASRKRAAGRGTRLPDDFEVTPEMVVWARKNCPDVDGRWETEKFEDHFRSVSGAKALKCDWVRTWQNWMRTAQDRAPAARVNGHKPVTASDKIRNLQRLGEELEREQLEAKVVPLPRAIGGGA